MTKKEIREGMITRFHLYLAGCNVKIEREVVELAVDKSILPYLDSCGVVLKVDECIDAMSEWEEWEEDGIQISVPNIKKRLLESARAAGYTKTERLV